MKVYLIRHGEPDYTEVKAAHYVSYGREFGGLTPAGIGQAQQRGQTLPPDIQLILTSPYTRALQTALEIARHTTIPVQVELGLHEWQPDLTGTQLQTDAEVTQIYAEYQRSPTICPQNFPFQYETAPAVCERVNAVLAKYANDYDCLACVTHGEVMHQLTGQSTFNYCEMATLNYPTSH
ncbi:histidine phosphatase family protein [Lactiplantibacillus fabifermentans]|uniref:Phosphoglycerate mutase n=2 Tax=Lactiplantibacillus fabifermentans TaxID=483011 RepID=A0A0R2NTD2_9LACO|nr:histidine phosphatase family protein [Lactiplantibacillus fabifermentans]ETY73478.1 nickel transporter [Lactiplantibacillus fabifermentans T30PCM01]KRO27219.1 hypothetical protein DY78_GL000190 [Lactiplantibacillus fabifermentans DSM 21115]